MNNELIIEKNEALRRITDYLTPRIRGEKPCSIQEQAECQEESKRLYARIAEIDAQMEHVELPVTEPVEPILATVDGLPLESYTKDIDSATLIRCEVEALIENERKKKEFEIASLKNVITNGKSANESLTLENSNLRDYLKTVNDKCAGLEDANNELKVVNHQLTIERDEAYEIRDNARKQLEEMAQELEAARHEVNRSREFKAQTEAERTAEQEAARQRFLDSRIKIYNVHWEDEYNRKIKVANLVETGEEIKFNYLEHGKYNEIPEDEALVIQAMNKPIEMPEVDEVVIFPETTSAEEAQSLDEQTDSGEQREVTEVESETWEQSVERRLNALEIKIRRNDVMSVFEAEVA